MDPEVVLAVVAFALCGVVVWLVAIPAGMARLPSYHPERLAWWRLVFPLFAGALVLAFLFGWSLQEPTPADERVGFALHLLALFTGAVVVRAVIRAVRSQRSCDRAHVAIGTIGLVKPKVIVSTEFRRAAPERVLAAALAHEAAHVRGRDPLRIWLAQFAADLQWPVPGAARRFSEWLLALEAKRDNLAVAGGIEGEDLAEAILIAARLQCGHVVALGAHVAGAGEGVAWRVRRLLSGDISARGVRKTTATMVHASCIGLVVTAIWLGVRYGDVVLGALPGMGQ